MIPYQLVSMAAILRDWLSEDDLKYKDQEHEYLTGIADYLYNVGGSPDELLPEYKELYDEYGPDYFAKVIRDMEALDGQVTGDRKAQELIDDYFDRLDTDIEGSTAVEATEDYSYAHNLVKISWKDAKFVLSNLNRSHKTVGMGGAGDPGYYVSEFEEATPGYMWASDKGLQILDDAGIAYDQIKKATMASTKISASIELIDTIGYIKNANGKFDVCVVETPYANMQLATYDPVADEYDILETVKDLDDARKKATTQFKSQPEFVMASNNPFYDKLSESGKRFVRNTEKKMATEFSPYTFDVYNALLPYIGDYESNTGWTGSCDLMKVEDDNTADGYLYKVIWDDGHDIDVFSWQINTNSRVGGDFTLMVMPAHGMPDFCDSENDFYRAIRKVFGNGLKKIDN